MQEIKIIKIDKAKVHDLQQVARKSFIETFAEYNSESDLNTYLNNNLGLNQLTKEIENLNSQFYLVYHNSKPIAYLKLNIYSAQTENRGDEYIEIERIYILKEFKGKGIGKELMKLAEQIGQEMSKSKIWLGVWEKNLDAIQFYTKMGFIKCGEHLFVLGEDKQTDWIMEKFISQ